jgi:hypothetical protein
VLVGCWELEERVTGITPDEESIAPASGLWNKEGLVQKEMGRRCGIDTAEMLLSIAAVTCHVQSQHN